LIGAVIKELKMQWVVQYQFKIEKLLQRITIYKCCYTSEARHFIETSLSYLRLFEAIIRVYSICQFYFCILLFIT